MPTCHFLAVLALAAPHGMSLQVSVDDAGAEDISSLGEAVGRALVAMGATVLLGPHAREHCVSRCVRLQVRRLQVGQFHIEARLQSQLVTTDVELPDDSSVFEQAQALAIQARLLADGLREQPAAAAASTSTMPATPKPAVAPPPTSVSSSESRSPVVPSPGSDDEPASRVPPTTAQSTPRPQLQPELQLPPEPPPSSKPAAEPHLCLAVGGIFLAGFQPRLVTGGIDLALRASLPHKAEAELGVTYLNDTHSGGRLYRQELRPFRLLASIATPWLPGLRAGLGAELIALDVDQNSYDAALLWSLGALARAEYRVAVKSIGVTASLAGAFHPGGDDDALFRYPPWSLMATLGLYFRVF